MSGRLFVLSYLLLALALPGRAQQVPPAAAASAPRPAAAGWEAVLFEQPAVALPLLTAAAVQHSAGLRALAAERDMSGQDVLIARKSILASVALSGIYSYGNLVGGYLADPQNPGNYTANVTSRYGTGVNVALPLDRIVSRNNHIRREELARDRAEALRQDRENELRQQVVQLYQSLVLAHRVLALRQQAFVSLQAASQAAEQRFAHNELSIAELTTTSVAFADAGVAQETARSQYETAFRLLEEVAGGRVSTLLAPAAP